MGSDCINIVLADDHVVLRQGVRALLDSVAGWHVVGEASDGLELITLVSRHVPQVVVLDLSMPNLGGIEAISRLRKTDSHVRIVVLSARDDEESVSDAMRNGASAYVTKAAGVDELQFAIRAVLKGQLYLSPAVCAFCLNSESGTRAASPIASLSDREREVMKLLSEGHPNREVAKVLHISPRTIDSHRANILRKLGVTTNAELVQLALKYKLIE